MASRAQLTQERSRQRRDELIAAALDLFAEGGSRAVTHRAVARRAGLPPATTTYYFDTIDDLLRQALREHLNRWRTELDSLAHPGALAGEVSAADVVDLVAAVFAARGPEVAAVELSIYLAATRDEALREEAAASLEGFERLAAEWLQVMGVEAPRQLAGAIVAVIVGTAVRRQCGLHDDASEAALLGEALRDLVGAHLVGRENIDQALSPKASAGLGSRA